MRTKNHLIFICILCGVSLLGCGSGSSPELEEDIVSEPVPQITEVTTIRDAPSEMNIGDLMWVNFDATGSAEISFAGIDRNARFRLLLQSAAQPSDNDSYSFIVGDPLNLSKDVNIVDESISSEHSINHPSICLLNKNVSDEIALISRTDYLTKSETVLSPEVGDRETFAVQLPSLVKVDIEAEAWCVSKRIAIYVDDRVRNDTPNDLPFDTVQMLCSEFDRIANLEIEWFGQMPDINGDGVVAVLLTPSVNQISSAHILGFVRHTDLYPRSIGNSYSNEREIMYLIVPNSKNDDGIPNMPISYLSDKYAPTFAHELQHIFNSYFHILAPVDEIDEDTEATETYADDGYSEYTWLNEGISSLVEDVAGYERPLELVYAYLNILYSNTISITRYYGFNVDVSQRGRVYLLLRYLYEQHRNPSQFLRSLVKSKVRGITNIEKAFKGENRELDEFNEFLLYSGIAIAFTDQRATSDRRFVYQPRQYNEATGQWQGICTVCQTTGTLYELNGPLTRIFEGATQRELLGTSEWFIDLINSESKSIPPILPISAPPNAKPQGALIRIK